MSFQGKDMRFVKVLFLVLSVGVAGCGGSDLKQFSTAAVSGTITLAGEPLTEGRVFFYPIKQSGGQSGNSGKFAQGMVESDGSYELSTYGNGDGAVVGDHRVTVLSTGAGDSKPLGAYDGTVTVKADEDNTIDINLTEVKSQGDDDEDEDEDD